MRGNMYYGSKKNDTWTGMLGAIASGEVDTIALDFTPSSERLDDFRFTAPFGGAVA